MRNWQGQTCGGTSYGRGCSVSATPRHVGCAADQHQSGSGMHVYRATIMPVGLHHFSMVVVDLRLLFFAVTPSHG